MPHARLTVDGEVLLDNELSTWSGADPAFVKSLVDPSVKPHLSLMAAGLILSQFVLMDKSVVISVVTDGPDKWKLEVEAS